MSNKGLKSCRVFRYIPQPQLSPGVRAADAARTRNCPKVESLGAPGARTSHSTDNPFFVGAVALPSLWVKRFEFARPRRLRLGINSALD